MVNGNGFYNPPVPRNYVTTSIPSSSREAYLRDSSRPNNLRNFVPPLLLPASSYSPSTMMMSNPLRSLDPSVLPDVGPCLLSLSTFRPMCNGLRSSAKHDLFTILSLTTLHVSMLVIFMCHFLSPGVLPRWSSPQLAHPRSSWSSDDKGVSPVRILLK